VEGSGVHQCEVVDDEWREGQLRWRVIVGTRVGGKRLMTFRKGGQ